MLLGQKQSCKLSCLSCYTNSLSWLINNRCHKLIFCLFVANVVPKYPTKLQLWFKFINLIISIFAVGQDVQLRLWLEENMWRAVCCVRFGLPCDSTGDFPQQVRFNVLMFYTKGPVVQRMWIPSFAIQVQVICLRFMLVFKAMFDRITLMQNCQNLWATHLQNLINLITMIWSDYLSPTGPRGYSTFNAAVGSLLIFDLKHSIESDVITYRIIHTTLVLSVEVFEPFLGYYFFNVLLMVLQALHIFWAGLILRMVYKFLKGKVRIGKRFQNNQWVHLTCIINTVVFKWKYTMWSQ